MRRAQTSWRRTASSIGLVLYVVLLCLYSVVPSGTLGTSVIGMLPGRDLAAHGLAYGALALSVCCLCAAGSTGTLTTAVRATVLATGLAGALELAQALLPWRTAALRDLAAGVVGASLAVGAWLAYRALTTSHRPVAVKTQVNAEPGLEHR